MQQYYIDMDFVAQTQAKQHCHDVILQASSKWVTAESFPEILKNQIYSQLSQPSNSPKNITHQFHSTLTILKAFSGDFLGLNFSNDKNFVKLDWAYEQSDHASVSVEPILNEEIKVGPGLTKVNASVLDDPVSLARANSGRTRLGQSKLPDRGI